MFASVWTEMKTSFSSVSDGRFNPNVPHISSVADIMEDQAIKDKKAWKLRRDREKTRIDRSAPKEKWDEFDRSLLLSLEKRQ